MNRLVISDKTSDGRITKMVAGDIIVFEGCELRVKETLERGDTILVDTIPVKLYTASIVSEFKGQPTIGIAEHKGIWNFRDRMFPRYMCVPVEIVE